MPIDTGDTAWVLVSAALVLFMTPGLAIFYGGMVRAKHVLAMLMQNFAVMAVVGLVWVWLAYSLAFGPDWGGVGLLGTLRFAGLAHLGTHLAGATGAAAHIPPLAFVSFQLAFAVITAALITGATADRLRFGPFLVFVVLWSLLVYAPIAHWVFSPGGWLAKLGVEDFAGGNVVEMCSGISGLALALVVGRRRGWPRQAMPPHNVPLTLLGAGILWFGWFGFNAGSALGANGLAAQAFINTNTAAAAGLLAWIAIERVRNGRATTLGGASGAVAGLVAITPACGFVDLFGATVIGLAAGVLCAFAVGAKFRVGIDDSLDVAGLHYAGGLVGTLLLGVFSTQAVHGVNGLAYGGGFDLLGHQLVGALAVTGFAFVATFALGKAVDAVMGLRVPPEVELSGLDLALHAETAYELTGTHGRGGEVPGGLLSATRREMREQEERR